MALAQGLCFYGTVTDISESAGLPQGASGNPRVITISMAANPNRAVVQIALTMERDYTTGLVTGDVIRFDLSADTAGNQQTFESALPVGTHVFANGK